jgi:hypothetical protein
MQQIHFLGYREIGKQVDAGKEALAGHSSSAINGLAISLAVGNLLRREP